jgi:hypothetical protein
LGGEYVGAEGVGMADKFYLERRLNWVIIRAMSNDKVQSPMLFNAVREPINEMIVVEVDDFQEGEKLIERLRSAAPGPLAVIKFNHSKTEPADLGKEIKKAIVGWPEEGGVLCLLETSLPEADSPIKPQDFWSAIGLNREYLAGLKCQTIFILQPHSYSWLNRDGPASHLKRWMSLKVHLRGPIGSAMPDMGQH